ncbi:bifunctional UDP-N-acetylglucosamine diphosphorylase/glucosamine-1-phosphate N-acetyltransferase GlmU [Aquamicrobium sp. LC103]|uniref:bifunctional UDP-N-acetylglucosamine diphosphorylase/glucosamine-1-phosphate N-acetyltransferase GlmU n=1 Tax=Aquamicrobium sp. LC103 TaxID=1120658 RepID=UPI00063E83A1|nr:bifunctional UDP-N-acetylglucosamine diphosphorylase/glucosamine-1-phosphate N-acetyltransferase GlmU [Aquamicrobium sp. LC103]TKT79317.1 bifunctional UDP-N-acetylglucosamine diphosphorylase/glucosamine-1-phosphate N-acetyltransferase GlmU [Aquamicrobium sp. LC103]
MSHRSCLTIILAAGEGTRMKSALPKVLHPIAGLPMIGHVVRAALGAGESDIAVVVGRAAERVREAVEPFAPAAGIFVQSERLGTAHAVLAAREAIARGYDDVLVVFGDTPLVRSDVLADLRGRLFEGAGVVVAGFRAPDPTGYGRLIEKDGNLAAIREHRDCSPEELKIDFCNGGLMAVAGAEALSLLEAVGNANAKSEYYLTDIVEIAADRGMKVVATEAGHEDVLGVNNRVELAEAEAIWQRRKRRELMLSGVSMTAPDTVHLSFDTEIGEETIVEPNVVFGPGAKVEPGAKIRAFSHIEGAHVSPGAEIGPFARLRPGADIGAKAKVGNFCEVKNAVVDEGAKINHLTYVGDAHVGAKANLGAGTITCNYDGFLKHHTEIGAGVFVGSNSSLVAPVAIGENAYIASGSVITDDVPADALAFGRARQVTKPDYGRRLREKHAEAAAKRKAEKGK